MAKGIPKAVRVKVYERDSIDGCPCCIWCGRPHYQELHHVRRRSQLGEHVPENLVTLCTFCHRKIHDGRGADIQSFAKEYLKKIYG